MEKYMLGVDIGTTNVKAVVYTFEGQEQFSASATYVLHTDENGAATQAIQEIEGCFLNVLREVTEECSRRSMSLEFLSLSTAMHSLILLDEFGEPLTPLITWADSRARKFAEEARKDSRMKELYQRNGTPIHSMSPLMKLLWLREEEPEIFEQAEKFVDLKSYLLERFVGEYVLDYSLANGTGLFHMEKLDWDLEALKLTGLRAENLPRLVPTTEVFRVNNSVISEKTGLPFGFPIVIGASDGCLANLGVGAIAENQFALSIGTSGALRTAVSEPVTNVEEQNFCYYLADDYWVIGGPVNNGGAAFSWAKDKFSPEISYEEAMELLAESPAGAEDLFFFPYLMGERAPFWSEKVSGSFFGLRQHHQKEHLLRAALEGINLNLYTVYQTLEQLIDQKTTQIRVTGGFTRSEIWLQMLADIFGVQLLVSQTSEPGCLGAAILGLYSFGEIETLLAVEDFVQTNRIITPHTENHNFYRKHFGTYKKINEKLFAIYESEWE